MVDLARTRSGLDRLEALIRYMFEVVDPMYLDELRAKIRTLGPHIEEAAMSIAEYLRKEGHQEGRREGRKEGHKEGHKEGRIDTLRDLLIFKFQRLGAEHEARLQVATPEAIDRYLQRLLTADSLATVFED